MGNITKERAVAAVLQGLSHWLDPTRATIATLGGEGHERRAWVKAGVPLARCWFIERDHARAARLVRVARDAHHFNGELREFARAFRAVASDATLDAFHWDLAGTVEPEAEELRYVLPLVMASASRCIIITCADQRDHRGTREEPVVQAWWQMLLGPARDRAFRATLAEEQANARSRRWTAANPARVIARERSALLHLLCVLADCRPDAAGTVGIARAVTLAALQRTRRPGAGNMPMDIRQVFHGGAPRVTFVPDAFVRVMYPSRRNLAHPGFRMRTIGMHLTRLTQPLSLRDAAARIADCVAAAPLMMIVPGSPGRLRRVATRHTPQPRAPERAHQQEEMTVEATDYGSRNLRDVLAARAKELREQAAALNAQINGQLDALVRTADDALTGLDVLAGQLGELRAAEDRIAAERQRQEELRATLGMPRSTAAETVVRSVQSPTEPAVPAATNGAPAAAAPPAADERPAKRRRRKRRRGKDVAAAGAAALTDAQKDLVKIAVVLAEATKTQRTITDAKRAAAKALGVDVRTVESFMRRMHGGHAHEGVVGILSRIGEQQPRQKAAREFLTAYKALGEVMPPVETLLREALERRAKATAKVAQQEKK